MKPSRRSVLRLGAASGAVLALEWTLPRARGARADEPLALAGRLEIAADGRITLRVGRSEMGQGVRTSLPMVVAEELGVAPADIAVEQAEPGPDFPDMRTSGSGSVFTQWASLRKLGATARELFLEAAAARLACPRGECIAGDGAVVHAASGRSVRFGELVGDARKLAIPRDALSKPASAFRVLGTSPERVDARAIVDGSAKFGLDVRVPGMVFATIERAPVFGAELEGFDDARAKAMPGVLAIVKVSTGVAVVARTTWEALQAREALALRWKASPNVEFGAEELERRLARALAGDMEPAREGRGFETAFEGAPRKLEALYEWPYQAHAPLEPLNAIADVRDGRCEIVAGTQAANEMQSDVAETLGIPPSAVRVRVPLLGGGFGLRLGTEYGREAAEISRALAKPVQVVWTRADTLKHAYYWPPSRHALRAGFDERGKLAAWEHRVASPSVLRALGVPVSRERAYIETLGASDVPYLSKVVRVRYAELEQPAPLGPWRGTWHGPNVFARECFLDEIAHATGRDPLELRLELLSLPDNAPPRLKEINDGLIGVLRLAADKAGWSRPRTPGRALGIACSAYDPRTFVAQVVEVERAGEGPVVVRKVTCAVDCGIVLHRSGLEGTIESAIHFALSAAVKSSIAIERGAVVQSSYADFPVVRIADAPQIEIHVVDSTAEPSGMGEPPVPPLAPALCNAVFAATGVRSRQLPLRL